ncbi:MAG: hypothetical protein ACFB10_08105 [Salibacteraceae bacterium]
MPSPYPFKVPSIPSAGVYYFETQDKVLYEVRFGRKRGNLLAATIVFGVLNEEYDGEEYVMTQRFDVFRVMATLQAIVMDFRDKNPNVRSFEFTGEPRAGEALNQPTKRIRVFKRFARQTFREGWRIETMGNKVIIAKE